jgi:hypothetical protein
MSGAGAGTVEAVLGVAAFLGGMVLFLLCALEAGAEVEGGGGGR